MAKKLEIVGIFNNSQIRRAFGEAIGDISKAKNAWSEMTSKMKTSETEISAILRKNTNEFKANAKEIIRLQQEQNSALKSKPWSVYDKEISLLKRQQDGIKNSTKELKTYLALEKTRALGSGIGGTALSIGAAGMRVLGGAAVVGGTALATAGMKGVYDNKELDKQMVLVYNALGTKNKGVQQKIKDNILKTSTETGIEATEIAQMQGFLYSSGFSPKAKQGTAKYDEEIQKTQELAQSIAISAKASGANSTDYMKAAIYTAGAYGSLDDLKDEKKRGRIFDMFAYSQQQGIGTMGEYAQNFSKFMPQAKNAGWSMEEAMMLFAETTKSYDANMAGHVVSNYAKMFGRSGQISSYFEGRVDGLDKKGNLQGSEKDKATLRSMTGKQISGMFFDEKHNARGMLETSKRIKEAYGKLEGGDAKQQFLDFITKGDSIAKKQLLMLLGEAGTITDENGIEQNIKKVDLIKNMIEKAGDVAGMNSSNIDNLSNSSSMKWDIMIQTWKNGFIAFANSEQEGIGTIVNGLTTLGEALPKFGRIVSDLANIVVMDYEAIRNYFSDGQFTGVKSLKNTAIDIIGTSSVGKGKTASEMEHNANSRAVEALKKMEIYGEQGNSAGFLGLGMTPTSPLRRLQGGINTNMMGVVGDLITGQDGKPLPGYIKDGTTSTLDVEKVLPIVKGLLENQSGKAKAEGASSAVIQSYDANIQVIDSLIAEYKAASELQRSSNSLQTQMLQQLGIIANKDTSFSSPITAFMNGLGSGGKDVKPGATPIATQ